MSTTVKDVAFAIAPLWVIDKRLQYHSTPGSGRMLDGINYNREGILRIDGRNNLPALQPVTFADQEAWGFGATGSLGAPIKSSMTMMYLVSARREYGLFQRDLSASLSDDDKNYLGTGILEWVARVRDAAERTTDGLDTIDALMEGSVSKPIITAVREAPATDLAWSAVIEFQIDIESICRGARSIRM